MAVVLATALTTLGCGSDAEDDSVDESPREEWLVEAGEVCSEFSSSFVDGEWAGAAPYAAASDALMRLPAPSDESAEALVSGMTEAADAVEAFAVGLDEYVEPGEEWQLTQGGEVFIGSVFELSATDMPPELGAQMIAAEDELMRAAQAVNLDECGPRGGVGDDPSEAQSPDE